MKNKFCSISFVDRCFNPLHKVKVKKIKIASKVFKREKSVVNGRITTRVVAVPFDVHAFDKFTVDDFTIENLSAVGALDSSTGKFSPSKMSIVNSIPNN